MKNREIKDFDVIIPTWNSMPELQKTLDTIINNLPRDYINKVIIVDRYSNDGTVEYADKLLSKKGFVYQILYDKLSLGSARMKGLQHSDTKWILFIDSDIGLTPDWYTCMMYWYNHLLKQDKKIGWIFGRTMDDRPKIRKMQMWEFKNKDGAYGGFKDGANKITDVKGFTNNSFCLRRPLLDPDDCIYDVSGYEDGLLTECMHKHGYTIYELPAWCNHYRVHVYGKWGEFTGAWAIYGMRKAGKKPKLAGQLWYLKKGLQYTFIFKDFFYIKHFTRNFFASVKALYTPLKEKDRGKNG